MCTPDDRSPPWRCPGPNVSALPARVARPASTPPSPGHCGGPGAAAGLSQRFRTPWKRWPAERLPQGTQGRGGESLPGASRSLRRARSPRPRSAWRIRATETAAPEVGAARASGAASAAAAAPRAATCTAARARARAAHTGNASQAVAPPEPEPQPEPVPRPGPPPEPLQGAQTRIPGEVLERFLVLAELGSRSRGPACCERSPHPRRRGDLRLWTDGVWGVKSRPVAVTSRASRRARAVMFGRVAGRPGGRRCTGEPQAALAAALSQILARPVGAPVASAI